MFALRCFLKVIVFIFRQNDNRDAFDIEQHGKYHYVKKYGSIFEKFENPLPDTALSKNTRCIEKPSQFASVWPRFFQLKTHYDPIDPRVRREGSNTLQLKCALWNMGTEHPMLANNSSRGPNTKGQLEATKDTKVKLIYVDRSIKRIKRISYGCFVFSVILIRKKCDSDV